MSQIFIIRLVLSAVVMGTVKALPIDSSVMAKPSWKSFTCQYYSDGTYICYPEHRTRNSTDDPATNELVDEAFAIVLMGKPVTGTWQSSDGFFSLPVPVEPKKYVGTCIFSEKGSWQCSGAPTVTILPDGNMIGVGGALFQGDHYTGIPGGSIQASIRADFPKHLLANGAV